MSTTRPRMGMPAMLPMMSTRPWVATAEATRPSTSARSVTSVSRAEAVPPLASISLATVWAPASSMSPSTTVAPAPASTWAVARPMPLAPPVSTATRPDRSKARVVPASTANAAIRSSWSGMPSSPSSVGPTVCPGRSGQVWTTGPAGAAPRRRLLRAAAGTRCGSLPGDPAGHGVGQSRAVPEAPTEGADGLHPR